MQIRALIGWILLLAVSSLVGQESPKFSAQERYFVESVIDNPMPYAGQQVVYTVRFYTEAMPAHDYIEPDFAGWWRGEQIASANAEVVDGKQYAVAIYETLLYPIQPGRLTIKPSRVVIPETVFSERVEFATQPITAEVQPLPEGVPAAFNGAVGRFDAEIILDKQTVMLGEPVTLSYRISGSGNVGQITPPQLTLPDNWRAYPNPTTSSLQTRGVGERVFEWRLVPEVAGSQVFPANVFTYFDPTEAVYRLITLPEFTVDVLPGVDGQRELPTFERGANAPAALTIKAVPSPLVLENNGMSVWLWMIPPLATLLVWGGLRFNTRRKAYLALQRQQNALKTAKAGLQAARKSNEGYLRVQEAIERYFADKVNHSQSRMTWAEIETVLKAQKSAEMARVLELLQRAEDGRYTPAGVIDLNALAVNAIEALTIVDQTWLT